jgi:hypothetical protein
LINSSVNCIIFCRTAADEEAFIPECPFCGKRTKGFEDKMCHVKSCGRKKGIPPDKQLAALRLQQKQVGERKDLGLPSQQFPQRKTSPVRFNKKPRVVSDPFFLLSFRII